MNAIKKERDEYKIALECLLESIQEKFEDDDEGLKYMVSSPIARANSCFMCTAFPEGAPPKTRALIQFRGEPHSVETLIDCLKLRRRVFVHE